MTVAGETHRCPPHEVLAAFVDARLPKTQVVALTEHLATCAECRFIVESASELQAEEQADSVEPQRRHSWRWLAVAAVVGVGFWLTPVTKEKWHTHQVKTAKLDLVETADGQKMRSILPRLTGFEYGEKPPVNRGAGDSPETQSIILQSKAQQLIELTKNDHSPAAAHERGIGELMLGQVDEAIADLKRATSSNDARAWSDLSAAYCAKRQYVEANDAANRAIKIDPNLNDAWFNRALAVSGIALTEPVVKYRWATKSSLSAEYAPLKQEPLVQMIAAGKATEVLRMTAGKQTPDAMHARGIAYLALDKRQEAIEDLTAVAKVRPDDARVLSDLAAALLTNGDYKKALDSARRAQSLDSQQPENLANLEAAYQRSGDAEIAAWNDYLKHDPASRWANEAREKLNGAREKLKELQEPS